MTEQPTTTAPTTDTATTGTPTADNGALDGAAIPAATPNGIAERRPFYAVAGAADIAVATLRELPGRVSSVVGDDRMRADVRRRFDALPADVKAFREGFPDFVLRVQGGAADLPQRLRERLEVASREAARTYGDLATRGEGVVERLRGEYGPAVQTVVANVRGRVADAADGVAEVTEKAADDIKARR